MAKKIWLMFGLLILVVAIAVPMTLFANSDQIKIEVQAEQNGSKLQVQLEGSGDSFDECVAMSGQLQYENGDQIQLQGGFSSDVVDSILRIYSDVGFCEDLEVSIDIFGEPITVTAEEEELLNPDGPAAVFGDDLADKVEVKLEVQH